MSHELRTPLNAIIGFSKLMSEHSQRRLSDAEIADYGGLIHDAADHLLAIINNILDISKIQSGKFSIDMRDIDVGEVLHVSAASLRLIAQNAGVTLTENIDRDMPSILGDGVRLRQVFTNLISNALKFTTSGGTVTVSTEARGPIAIITVSDTGIGMTEDELAVALTPFGQVEASHNRWREGTGLGLPIARALVKLHGGDLVIESTKGVGTTVKVMLPIAETGRRESEL